MASLKGPFNVPDESFEEPTFKRLLGEQWSLTPDGWIAAGMTSLDTKTIDDVLSRLRQI